MEDKKEKIEKLLQGITRCCVEAQEEIKDENYIDLAISFSAIKQDSETAFDLSVELDGERKKL